jgi:hypothetical protein
MNAPRLTPFRITVGVIILLGFVLLVLGLAFAFGDSSSDIKDVPITTTER